MLLELGLENFVLIPEASVSFGPGLTALTGETGAGKSLLVQALKLVLGERATPLHVRTGAEQAVVQAAFDLLPETRQILDEMGISADEELIVRRVLPRSGRGRVYVNGALCTLQDLKRVTEPLISLAGQHEFQELLRKERHRPWLDRYAVLDGPLETVGELYRGRKALVEQLERLRTEASQTAEEMERLDREAREIDGLDPQPGEDVALEQELRVLKAAAELRAAGETSYAVLYGERGAVLERLGEVRAALGRMAGHDPRLEPLSQDLEGVICQTEDLALALRDYVHGLPTDLSRLEWIEERLYRLRDLCRRFGPELEDVLAHRRGIEVRRASLRGQGEEAEGLEEKIRLTEARLLAEAEALSERRRQAAKGLSEAVEAELAHLKFARAEFVVEVARPEAPQAAEVGPAGFDRVQFLFCPNVGEPARPLDAIASGGELSRVMLALRAVLARQGGVDVAVFDEIDAGLGGEVAERVGRKLKALASGGQVLAVTHFPQIAALADHHIVVEKRVADQATVTEIRVLGEGERLGEIARMLGGNLQAAKAYAQELLRPAGEP